MSTPLSTTHTQRTTTHHPALPQTSEEQMTRPTGREESTLRSANPEEGRSEICGDIFVVMWSSFAIAFWLFLIQRLGWVDFRNR